MDLVGEDVAVDLVANLSRQLEEVVMRRSSGVLWTGFAAGGATLLSAALLDGLMGLLEGRLLHAKLEDGLLKEAAVHILRADVGVALVVI